MNMQLVEKKHNDAHDNHVKYNADDNHEDNENEVTSIV